MTIVFKQTDFPEPVAPAISTCGIFSRDETYARPFKSFPSASGSSPLARLNSGASSTSLRFTISGFGLGISTPTAPLPGIGATIRTLFAFIAKARSASRLAIRFTFTPGAGITSNCVTIGPVVRSPRELSTLKVRSFSIRTWPNSSSCRSISSSSRLSGPDRSAIGGTSCSISVSSEVSVGTLSLLSTLTSSLTKSVDSRSSSVTTSEDASSTSLKSGTSSGKGSGSTLSGGRTSLSGVPFSSSSSDSIHSGSSPGNGSPEAASLGSGSTTA